MTTLPQAVFNGTQTEGFDLMEAFNHNCECQFGPLNMRTSTCLVHDSMLHDQRFLNGLIFMRRRVDGLLRGEFILEAPSN